MYDEIKLTGLAKLSPRLNLLLGMRRGNYHPLTHIVINYILTEKLPRRVGGIFEFGLLVVLPLILLTPSIFNFAMGMIGGVIILMIYILSIIFIFISISYSFRIGLLPGLGIFRRDQDGNTLKFLMMNPRQLQVELGSVQFFNLVVPIIISTIIVSLIVIYLMQGHLTILILTIPITVIIIADILARLGLFCSFTFFEPNRAFIAMLAIFIVLFMFSVLLSWTFGLYNYDRHDGDIGLWIFEIIYWACVSGFANVLAYNAIRARIMPSNK